MPVLVLLAAILGTWQALPPASTAAAPAPRSALPLAPARVAVSGAVRHDTSPPLRDLAPASPRPPFRPLPVARPAFLAQRVTGSGNGIHTSAPRPDTLVTGLMPAPAASFDGLGQGFGGPQGSFTDSAYPPDPNSAVGITDVVETVNFSMAVFDKSGTVLYGPIDAGAVFSGFGGVCETTPFGDPTVHYDHLANRWMLVNMAGTSPMATSGDECVAVSVSADPTGAYYRYASAFSGLPDYAKLAVWPDAYYLSADVLEPQFTPTFCALDRAAMLTGAAASAQCFADPLFRQHDHSSSRRTRR